MTTFQDPPLQSRRSVRQNERDSAVVPTTGPTPTPVAPAAPGEPLTYATQNRPAAAPDYDGPSFRARRTPDPVGDIPADAASADGTFRPRDYSPEGRRSATPNWAPQYGGAGQPPVSPAEPPVVPADPASNFAPHAPAEPQIVPSALDSEEAVEHTLTRRELRALRDAHGITATTTGETAYPTPEAAAVAPAAEPAAPIQDVAPAVETPLDSAGTRQVAPSSRLDSALAEFDQLAAGRPAAVPSDPPAARGRRAAPKAEEPVEAAPVAEAPVAEAPVAEAPSAPAAAGPAQVSADVLGPEVQQLAPVPLIEPPAPQAAAAAPVPQPEPEVVVAEIVAEPIVAEPVVAEPVLPEPVAAEAVVAEPVVEPAAPPPPQQTVVETVIVDEPSTATPPTGHWSTQAQLDDETQFGDEKLARNIGSTSGAITTSALVLPSIPDHDFGPLTTGDGTVTGSISLPASMSATGAHPAQLDESDLDHLLDPGDHQVANTDSQPVRAIRAVSTHTSSRGVIGVAKPKGTKGLTALIIAATGMAVLVGALFIVLVVTGQLG